jgi:hypothetical protein
MLTEIVDWTLDISEEIVEEKLWYRMPMRCPLMPSKQF